MPAPTTLIIGAGLLGASLGLALRDNGAEVYLRDTSPTSLALARDLGAGSDALPTGVELVIVAVPPDVTAACIEWALAEFPEAVVTDVASVKDIIATELSAAGVDLRRYVGSHPMAGRERSGAASAHRDLFIGKPWVIVAQPQSDPAAVDLVRSVAVAVGSFPVTMSSKEHDEAVAVVSHVPQLMASLTASRLAQANPAALELAGQGLRDTTRIAASDPRLWTAIIAGNAGPVHAQLEAIAADLDQLLEGIAAAINGGVLAHGSVASVNRVMTSGNEGVGRIPGKHGGAPRRYAEVAVFVPDKAGELGRLFSEVGEIGVNIEDLVMEHSPGALMGAARLAVSPAAAQPLRQELSARGWQVLDS